MNLNIDGLGSPQPPGPPRCTALSGSTSFESVLKSAAPDAVGRERRSALPATPPPEVAQAINRASEVYERLSATGQQMHFVVDSPGGAVAVELQDLGGNPLGTISGSEALRIAGGESLN